MRFPVCFHIHQAFSEKGSVLKGINLLPRGVNSFPLQTIPFPKGSKLCPFRINPFS